MKILKSDELTLFPLAVPSALRRFFFILNGELFFLEAGYPEVPLLVEDLSDHQHEAISYMRVIFRRHILVNHTVLLAEFLP